MTSWADMSLRLGLQSKRVPNQNDGGSETLFPSLCK